MVVSEQTDIRVLRTTSRDNRGPFAILRHGEKRDCSRGKKKKNSTKYGVLGEGNPVIRIGRGVVYIYVC